MPYLADVGLSVAANLAIWYSFKDPNPNTSEESKARVEKDIVFRNPKITWLALGMRKVTVPSSLLHTLAIAAGLVDMDVVPYAAMARSLLALAVVGGAVRVWCYRTLSTFFTFQLSIQDDHRIVQSGPYAWLAHPSYLGAILVLPGLYAVALGPYHALCTLIPHKAFLSVVLFNSITVKMDLKDTVRALLAVSTAVMLFMNVFLFRQRISDEEVMLKKHFGRDYDDYLATRWRLFPGLY